MSESCDALTWAVQRWNDEVKNRPLVNVHRRTLDDTWRQVMRHFGGDPDALVGPSHDSLRAELTTAQWQALNADEQSRAMFVARLENMRDGPPLGVDDVLALLNDCDMLAAREIRPCS
jgi:hypothetical protein